MMGIKGGRAVYLHAKASSDETSSSFKITVWLTGRCDRWASLTTGPGVVRFVQVAPCILDPNLVIDMDGTFWVPPSALIEMGEYGELFNPEDAETTHFCKVDGCDKTVCEGSNALCMEHLSESA
jgi:hypothetical protein